MDRITGRVLILFVLGFLTAVQVEGRYYPAETSYSKYAPDSTEQKTNGYGSSNSGRYAGYNYYNPPPKKSDSERPKDELDKVHSRLENVLDQLKTAEEQYGALATRLSLQKKFLDELTLVIFVALSETDVKQDQFLDKLEEHLASLMSSISHDLTSHISALSHLNSQITNSQEAGENAWASERAHDVRQDKEITALYSAVRDFKEKLFQVKENEFECFCDSVETATGFLTSIKNKETSRMCETGQVTLDAGDLKAEYQYQTWFDKLPQVLYGLCGFNFDLDAREEPENHLYGYTPKEPNAVGVRVNAFSSKTGLTVEAFDLGFADSTVVTVDVCFQACSIGPGPGPVHH